MKCHLFVKRENVAQPRRVDEVVSSEEVKEEELQTCDVFEGVCERCNSEPLMRFKDMSPSMELCDECVSEFASYENGDDVY